MQMDYALQSREVYLLKARTLRRMKTYTEDDEVHSPTLPGFSCSAANIFRS
jgi:hypothetical protein